MTNLEREKRALVEKIEGKPILKRRRWVVGKEYTSNMEGFPVLVAIETNNGFVIARDVTPHDAKEIVESHNTHIVDRLAPELLEALKRTIKVLDNVIKDPHSQEPNVSIPDYLIAAAEEVYGKAETLIAKAESR